MLIAQVQHFYRQVCMHTQFLATSFILLVTYPSLLQLAQAHNGQMG